MAQVAAGRIDGIRWDSAHLGADRPKTGVDFRLPLMGLTLLPII